MEKFTIDRIDNMCKVIKNKFPNYDYQFLKLFFSIEVLRIIFGNDYVNNIFFDKKGISKGKNDKIFLNTKFYDFYWMERTYRIAERLLYLQEIENIDEIILKIKEGDLFGRYGELEFGSIFHRKGIKFKYNKALSRKGLDFDIVISGEVLINCEVKHKINSSFNKNRFEESLKKAIKQMPEKEYSLLCFKISYSWLDNNIDLVNTINKIFNRYKFLSAILLRWEEQNNGLFLYKNKLFKSNFVNKDILLILDKLELNNKLYFDLDIYLKTKFN